RDGDTLYLLDKAKGALAIPDPTTGATTPLMDDGTLTKPNDILVNPLNHHLLVSTDSSAGLVDIDPTRYYTTAAPPPTYFNVKLFGDGMDVSADDSMFYLAANNHVYGFQTATGTQVFDSGAIVDPNTGTALGSDGVALGTGVLAGQLFVNANGGELVEVDLATAVQ